MPKRHWIIKSEPSKFSFSQLVKDGRAVWDGVRNFEARNNLRAMAVHDLLLFYHSNEGKEIVGVAQVTRPAYQDPTTDGDWSAVDIAPVAPLRTPVTLSAIKDRAALRDFALVRKPRVSVAPVTAAEFRAIQKMGHTSLD